MISSRAWRRETSRSSSTTAAAWPSRPRVAGSAHTRSLVSLVCRSVTVSLSSGMVDHRAAQIGSGQSAHESPAVDHGKPADPAVDHYYRRPGKFIGRTDRRRLAHNQGVDDAVRECPAALEESAERVGKRAASSVHVIEAGQHGPHQVFLGKRTDELAVVVKDHQLADLRHTDHLSRPPDGRAEPYVGREWRHDVADLHATSQVRSKGSRDPITAGILKGSLS